ncbi:MAG: response regulator [Alphaproteobacteria bacterium]|nr:response regulator [Alphaproteobacteria bacterium]MBU1513075.1 response regulator [Alphaproteobacteria bacterium]MBU2095183.1 response regulator [Alphaproteobacteria bacterium]MBU2150658.1 response regulator [Alphaproteobacteria bacterium]MBU2306083.1 response regulator [Alphaproteobacteria bacterium]
MSNAPERPRILLADDEVLVRNLLQEVLEEAGYEVVTAATGAEALARLEEGDAFTGLVTDINFGGPPVGWEVATRARELQTSIAVVYMTGDSAHEWSAHGVPQSTVIGKPFAPSQITVALASMLNTTDGPT